MTSQQGTKPRDLNTHHMPAPPASLTEWQSRAGALRSQIRYSLGLWPAPVKTPLNPRITGRMEGDGFIVENVAIETLPGFYLCGNLYRPASGKGPFPAIVNPHGHWQNGRLQHEADVPPPAPGAKFADGRADLVAIGANLARQGFVVFAYDMVGYNDTDQLGEHDRFAGNLRSWSWNISFAGLQTWNSIRAADYLVGLPYVDKRRIGVTGASGGGTQAFLLCAVDDRIKAAVPVNMVSAYMQGGCKCENAPGLRVGTDNVEIAALMAPKPLLLIAATGDWTIHVPKEEWPAIRAVYSLFGSEDKTAVQQFNYNHNYNGPSREAMYAWFARWLKGAPASVQVSERPLEIDTARLRVWNARNQRPAGALDDAQLTSMLKQVAERWLRDQEPRDAASLRRFRQSVAPMLALALSVNPATGTAPARATSGTRSVLLASDTASADRAGALRAALGARGCDVTEVSLAPIGHTEKELWQGFLSCYNRTPLGDRVQQIADALADLRSSARRPISVVGVGAAGPWTLLAAGLVPVASRVAADTCRLDTARDEAYIPGLYAPGLRRAGDLRSAAMLTAPADLCLLNTGGSFDSTSVARAYRGSSASAPRIEDGDMTPDALAQWVAGE